MDNSKNHFRCSIILRKQYLKLKTVISSWLVQIILEYELMKKKWNNKMTFDVWSFQLHRLIDKIDPKYYYQLDTLLYIFYELMSNFILM